MASTSKKTATRKSSKRTTPADKLEVAAGRRGRGPYVLRLYVTGMTGRSMRAIENLKAICEEYLPGRYDLEIVDIYQRPTLLQGEQIIAAPTLVKKLPEPLRRLVGDMSNKERVLFGLDLKPKK